MTNLILVRHGETVWHADNRYTGRTDVPLTDRGRTQARRLAEWSRCARLRAVVSSNLSRARETAQPSADVTGLPLLIEPRLREVDFGDAEGLTTEAMIQRFPDALAAFHADPAANPLPGGEDPKAAIERGLAALDQVRDEHPKDRVLVVTHTTLLRLLLCQLLGLPPSEYRRVFPSIRNCGRTELLLRNDRASLLEYNSPTDAATNLKDAR